MTWPSSDVSQNNTDSDADSPLLARPDLNSLIAGFNQIRNHVSSFIQGLLDDADADTALTTLGAAPLASPALTGTPSAPTASVGTDTTQLATTAFVQDAVTRFESSEVAVPASGSVTVAAHNLSSVPRDFQIVLLNKTTELGYAVNDEVALPISGLITVYADATNIGLVLDTVASIAVVNRSTATSTTITSGNWKLLFRAWE